MKIKFVIILFLFCLCFVNKHDLKNIKYKTVTVNKYGTIYYINENNEIIKWSEQKGEEAKFLLPLQGENTIIDAENPMEIVLFFTESGNVMVLDNQLNIKTQINVFNQSNFIIAACGRSNDGNVWILDKNARTLKKFGVRQSLFQESLMLNIDGMDQEPQKIYDDGEKIIVLLGNGKSLEFNANLALQKSVSHTGKMIGLNAKYWYYTDSNLILAHAYSNFFVSEKADTINIKDSSKAIQISGNYLLKAKNNTVILQTIAK